MRVLWNIIDNPMGAASIATRYALEGHIIDTAEVCARINALFDFARFRSELTLFQPTTANMTNALRNIGFWHEYFPDIDRQVERRYPVGPM